MPTYDFRCTACDHCFSQFASIKDREQVRCPACGGAVAQRFTGFLYAKKGEGKSGGSCSSGSCSSCGGCH